MDSTGSHLSSPLQGLRTLRFHTSPSPADSADSAGSHLSTFLRTLRTLRTLRVLRVRTSGHELATGIESVLFSFPWTWQAAQDRSKLLGKKQWIGSQVSNLCPCLGGGSAVPETG